MYRRIASQILVISWLALAACLWTTGDLVVDLAFETPDVSATAEASTEEPDNAAEHLLMPSAQADRLATDTLAATPVVDLDAASLTVALSNDATPRASPTLHYPPRNKPVAFSIPLRI